MPNLISIKGFTLLELLIVIAIAAVLMAIGVPNFSKWKEKHEINGQAQKVYSDMMLARSTSIKNNNNVLITFDTAKNLYKVHDDTDSDGVEDHGEAVKSVNLENNVEFGYVPELLDIEGNQVTSPILLSAASAASFACVSSRASRSSSVCIPISVRSSMLRNRKASQRKT